MQILSFVVSMYYRKVSYILQGVRGPARSILCMG